ncbi:MAG: hypothetical protein IKH49_08595 [Bacteroidales bacterium]|nr:hypothetical protein [Bacteroidales bacterium]
MSNQSLTGNPVRLSGLLAGAAAMLVFPFLSSCRHDDPNAERPEFVEVYEHPDSLTPLSAASVSVRKGEATFYVKTNVEVTPRWQDAETKPWASVTRFEKIKDDLYELQLTYAKRYNIPYYTRRSGTLMLTAPDLSLGSYLPVYQGLTARLSSDMSWSKYGSSDPRKLDGKISSEWSATDKNRGWESTVIDGREEAYLYGKNGYLMLGSGDGYGADLFTPYVDDLHRDTLIVLSFRAVAYTDLDGNKDANKLTVEVVGGGVIRDFEAQGTTKIEFEAPYYDLNSEKFPSDMWDEGQFLVGIVGTDTNPLTSNTRIRFTAGSLSPVPGKPNRIFLDNVYLRKITSNKHVQDEDLFLLNGGKSGKDTVFQKDDDNQ